MVIIMKFRLLVLTLLFTISANSFSQISKADIENMLSDFNVKIKDIKSIEIRNKVDYYSNGKMLRNNIIFSFSEGCTFNLLNTGISIKGYSEDKNKYIEFYPYNHINRLFITESKITCWLVSN